MAQILHDDTELFDWLLRCPYHQWMVDAHPADPEQVPWIVLIDTFASLRVGYHRQRRLSGLQGSDRWGVPSVEKELGPLLSRNAGFHLSVAIKQPTTDLIYSQANDW